MSEIGLIQVYTGTGKGKTTAALGLIVRALGHGQRVLLVRLLKSAECPSGELRFLAAQPGIRIIDAGLGVIHRQASAAAVRDSVVAALAEAEGVWQSEACDLLVLDEINNALHREAISLTELWALLDRRPAGMEVVLTGRNAPAALLERADLVTNMENVRHPLAQGIPARAGIDY